MDRRSFKEIVKEYHLSYKTLMEILNKSKPTIQTYMSGRTDPDVNSYIAIAQYLNIGLDEMLGLTKGQKLISMKQYNELKIAHDILADLLK